MNLSIGHIAINVTDLARSLAFYTELLDLHIAHEVHEGERHLAFLTNDNGIFLTMWQQSTGAFSTERPGLHHLAFQVEGADEVRAFFQKALDKGVTLEYDRIVSHGAGSDSGGVFFLDPDGIRLEVYATSGIGEYGPA